RSPGRNRAVWVLEPKWASGRAAPATADHTGTGATRRPCCCRIVVSPSIPMPAPPADSGRASPSSPEAARAFLRVASKPPSVCSTSTTRSTAAREPKTCDPLSSTAIRSSSSSNSMSAPRLGGCLRCGSVGARRGVCDTGAPTGAECHPEGPGGDDLAHHLVAATAEGVVLGAPGESLDPALDHRAVAAGTQQAASTEHLLQHAVGRDHALGAEDLRGGRIAAVERVRRN